MVLIVDAIKIGKHIEKHNYEINKNQKKKEGLIKCRISHP